MPTLLRGINTLGLVSALGVISSDAFFRAESTVAGATGAAVIRGTRIDAISFDSRSGTQHRLSNLAFQELSRPFIKLKSSYSSSSKLCNTLLEPDNHGVYAQRLTVMSFRTSREPIHLPDLRQRTHKRKSSISLSKTQGNDPIKATKANVRLSSVLTSRPVYLSPVDSFLAALTSDRTSILLGSFGLAILFLNRLLTFPDGDSIMEASRSRVDLLGVFAAGSVLLNGITKLDVTSAQSESVTLMGFNLGKGKVYWNDEEFGGGLDADQFRSAAEWALNSFIDATPAKSAVLLQRSSNGWSPLAMAGVLPSDPREKRPPLFLTPFSSSPILDRTLRTDGAKGGTVGGTAGGGVVGNEASPKESYLPTLQALPGRVEFNYLPINTQEALVLPISNVPSMNQGNKNLTQQSNQTRRRLAIVLGGDTAKSFTPRDISWCREVASWIGGC